ncbi:hypothetical protein TNCV_516421 [Trichonephila clavipes]|nr:hypothetical protein TNCV_516421 [Trichonephila clavipes]
MLNDQSVRGHCLLFDLGEASTPRLAVIMVKREPAPIDNRRRLYEKKTVAMTGDEKIALDGESPEKRLGRWRIETGIGRERKP